MKMHHIMSMSIYRSLTEEQVNNLASTIGEVTFSNFMCIQLNTQPNTQNSCGLEVCIPIGFYVKVIFNKLVSFAPEVIKFT